MLRIVRENVQYIPALLVIILFLILFYRGDKYRDEVREYSRTGERKTVVGCFEKKSGFKIPRFVSDVKGERFPLIAFTDTTRLNSLEKGECVEVVYFTVPDGFHYSVEIKDL